MTSRKEATSKKQPTVPLPPHPQLRMGPDVVPWGVPRGRIEPKPKG
jgi:hypothetical protein